MTDTNGELDNLLAHLSIIYAKASIFFDKTIRIRGMDRSARFLQQTLQYHSQQNSSFGKLLMTHEHTKTDRPSLFYLL